MEAEKLRGKKAEHFHYMADAMRRLEWDLHHKIEATGRVPVEWHEIAQEEGRVGTERTSLRLDRDVLRFFKSMGLGYGPRINRVLRTYMHARLAGVIRGADTAPMFRVPMAGERPLWGETAQAMGVGDGPGAAEREVEALARVAEAEERSKSYYIKKGLELILQQRLEDLEDYEAATEAHAAHLESGEPALSMDDVFGSK